MQGHKIRIPGVLLSITALSFSILTGCTQSATFFPPPYIPAEYYDCAPIEPQQLIWEYFGDHAEFRWAEVNIKYNDVVFILENLPVDEQMFAELDQGFIWAEQIKCYLLNPGAMSHLERGDNIDIVGRNAGPSDQYLPELTFTECVVIPAGLLALPVISDDDSFQFVPSY